MASSTFKLSNEAVDKIAGKDSLNVVTQGFSYRREKPWVTTQATKTKISQTK